MKLLFSSVKLIEIGFSVSKCNLNLILKKLFINLNYYKFYLLFWWLRKVVIVIENKNKHITHSTSSY